MTHSNIEDYKQCQMSYVNTICNVLKSIRVSESLSDHFPICQEAKWQMVSPKKVHV
jgi:hypothetical protein